MFNRFGKNRVRFFVVSACLAVLCSEFAFSKPKNEQLSSRNIIFCYEIPVNSYKNTIFFNEKCINKSLSHIIKKQKSVIKITKIIKIFCTFLLKI